MLGAALGLGVSAGAFWSGAWAAEPSVPGSGPEPLVLGSGKTVELLSVGPLQSPQGWVAMLVKYRTAVPLSDLPALREEVDEVWNSCAPDLEHSAYTNAIISASADDTGAAPAPGNVYNFVFEVRDDSWRTFEPRQRAQAGLDPAFVRAFVHRLDTAFEHAATNALLLYIANDWTLTIASPNAPPQTLDRKQFAATGPTTLAAAWRGHRSRAIADVSIGDGGTTARVTSTETIEPTDKDRRGAALQRVTDSFALRGDMMLWTKSEIAAQPQAGSR